MPLGRCGLDPSRRFTFFDQIHTTGMDIPQVRYNQSRREEKERREGEKRRREETGESTTGMDIPQVRYNTVEERREGEKRRERVPPAWTYHRYVWYGIGYTQSRREEKGERGTCPL